MVFTYLDLQRNKEKAVREEYQATYDNLGNLWSRGVEVGRRDADRDQIQMADMVGGSVVSMVLSKTGTIFEIEMTCHDEGVLNVGFMGGPIDAVTYRLGNDMTTASVKAHRSDTGEFAQVTLQTSRETYLKEMADFGGKGIELLKRLIG